jgi:iron complex transport system ATP-binding protein
MVALLGRNGSGKSTLLNLAAGLRRPAAGQVRFEGGELDRLPAHERARRIAMVPQVLPIPFAFTVRELVSLGRTPYLSVLRGERVEDRVAIATAMQRAGVESLAGRLAGELSGGEQQRVALALALAQEPALLLLDEATAHLDLHHQLTLLGMVRDLNRQHGLTVFAAIHDVNLAALWFDRLLLLDERRLLADGPPAGVLRPDLLERAFGSPVLVIEHPTAGVPLVALERPAEA